MINSAIINRKLTAALAIMSVLLLFVAPLVSTSLLAAHAQQHADACDRVLEQTDSSMATMMPTEQGEHYPMMHKGLACGYCDLLIHVPFLSWLGVALLWLLCFSRWVKAWLADPTTTYSFHCCSYHSRAPPPIIEFFSSNG